MGTATNCAHWRDYSWKCFWLGCQGSLKVRVGTFIYCNVLWYLVLIARFSKWEWRKPRILFRFVDHCHCSALACRSLKTFLSNAITDVYLLNVYCSQIYNLLASWTIFSVLDSRLGPSKSWKQFENAKFSLEISVVFWIPNYPLPDDSSFILRTPRRKGKHRIEMFVFSSSNCFPTII